MIQGRYQVVQPVGEGGLGTVYYGWDQQLERAVAIKRLNQTSGLQDPTSEAYQEARTLAALQHPNVVTLYDFGMDEEGAYFIMEYLPGQTLGDRITAGTLSREELLSLAQQCLEGLGAAHEAGIIHRDIKPTNIMLLEARRGPFRAKLLDFGLARSQQAPREQTVADDGSMLGSVFYMAPEQLSRRPIDARTDLYALGHVFYHALAGETAHTGSTIMDLIAAHLNDEPHPIQSYRQELDDALAQWVHWLMAKDPDARPASAQDALDHLPGDHATGPVELAMKATPPPPARRPQFNLNDIQPAPAGGDGTGRGSGMLWWVLGGVLVLAVGAGAFFLTGGTPHQAEPPVDAPLAEDSKVSSASPPADVPEPPPVSSTPSRPEPAPDSVAPVTPPPGEQAEPSPPVTDGFAPDDLLKLSQHVGQSVRVEGRPIEVSQNRSRTIYYLNFTEDYTESLSLVFFISDQPDEFTRDRLSQYVGKRIRVHGEVERYRTDLQMKIRSLDQIEIRN